MTELTTKLIRVAPGHWSLNAVDGSADLGELTLEALAEADLHRLIVDLAAVPHVDSQGLKLLYDLHRGLRAQNVPLVLRNPPSPLHRLLKILQFNRLFTIEFD